MADIANLNVIIGANIDSFERSMREAERGIGRLGQGLKTAGAGLSAALTLPLGLLGGAALAASAQIDTLRRGLQAVTQQQLSEQGVTGIRGIAQASTDTKARLLELRQVAALPGLGFAEAVQGDIRLRAVGISADLSKRALLAFGNAIATTGGGKGELDRVTVQLGQLSAKGKVLAQDLRPIIEAAPAVATALKKLYGTVDSETISKSLEKQGKSSTEFIDTLTNELAKLPAVTGGLKNAFENLADSGQIGLAKLGDSLNKAFNIEDNLGKLGNFVTTLADKFEALSPAAQKAIFVVAGLAAAAGPLLFAIGAIGAAVPAITAGFATFGITSLGALAPLLLPIAAVAAGAVLIYQNWDKLAPAFSQAADTIGAAIGQIRQAFGSIDTGSSFGDLLKGLNLVDVLVREIKAGVQGLADTFAGTVAFITALLNRDFTGALEGIRQTAEGLLAPLLNVFGIVRTKAVELKGSFAAAFQPIEEVTGLLGGDIAASLAAITKPNEAMVKALAEVRKSLLDVVRQNQALGDVYDLIETKQNALTAGVKTLVSAGFSPFSKEVRGLVLDLQNLNNALGPIANLQSKTNVALKLTPSELPTALGYNNKIGKEDQFFKLLTDKEQQFKEFTAGIKGLMADLGASIGPLLADFAGQFGEAFGGIITGTASAGDALANLFGGILQSIGGFMSKFGAQLIAIGIGKVGLDSLFTGPAGGPAAIAAGIGLVALGGIASAVGRSAASSISAIGSGGGGGGNGPAPTRFTPTVAPTGTGPGGPTTVTHNVVFDLQGNNLLAAISINTDRLGRVTGRY